MPPGSDPATTTGADLPESSTAAPHGRRPHRRRRAGGLHVVEGGPRAPRSTWKVVVVAVLGSVVTLAGVAALVLPGPGFLLVAAGLAILATQFRWARRPLRYATVKAQDGIDEVAKSTWRTAFAVCCGLVLVAVGVLAFTDVEIPYVDRYVDGLLNGFTGGTLVASGLFLVGLVVYARRTGGVSAEGTEARQEPGER